MTKSLQERAANPGVKQRPWMTNGGRPWRALFIYKNIRFFFILKINNQVDKQLLLNSLNDVILSFNCVEAAIIN